MIGAAPTIWTIWSGRKFTIEAEVVEVLFEHGEPLSVT